jgi:macrocin-O-methyltransferase TylF-like protien
VRNRLRALLNRFLPPRLELAAQRALERDARDIEQARQSEALASTVRFLDEHAPGAAPFPDSESPMRHAASLVLEQTPGLVCEFGVWRGDSLRRLAALFSERTIYGFDSFEGLPEDWKPGFPQGHFRLETHRHSPRT